MRLEGVSGSVPISGYDDTIPGFQEFKDINSGAAATFINGKIHISAGTSGMQLKWTLDSRVAGGNSASADNMLETINSVHFNSRFAMQMDVTGNDNFNAFISAWDESDGKNFLSTGATRRPCQMFRFQRCNKPHHPQWAQIHGYR